VLNSPSPTESITDIDLDLDSLFKRLDKYTTEMEEVEARLKKNRSPSDGSHHINIKRFSFEINQLLSNDQVLPPAPAGSTKPESSLAACIIVNGAEELKKDDGAVRNGENLDGETEDSDEPFLIIQSNAHTYHDQMTESTTENQLLVSESIEGSKKASFESGCDLHIPIQNNARQGSMDHSMEPSQVKPTSASEVQLPIKRPTPSSPNTEKSPRPELVQEATMHPSKDQKKFLREPHHMGQGIRSEETDYSDIDEPYPAMPAGWSFPPRTSSKTFPVEDASDKTEESPPQPPRRRVMVDNRPSVRHGGFWSAPPLLFPDQEPIPPVPSLSQSGSIATITSSPPLTPLSLCSPREDQIRRELESFALHEGPETLVELKYQKRRPPRLDLVDFDGEGLEVEEEGETQPEPEKKELSTSEPNRTRPRRSKSIISIFQRKSPIDKVIDLYFDDEPEEKPPRPLPRWTTISRKGSPTTANMPRSPRVPPMPATGPGLKQTSVS